MSVDAIKAQIDRKEFKPIYLLQGDELFFIQELTKYFEDHVLTEEEKAFNFSVFYGKEHSIEQVLEQAKRLPMMADKQLIVVKEAQHLLRQFDKLEFYLNDVVSSSIIVFCVNQKKLDKRKKAFKQISQIGEVFESKPLYDNQLAPFVDSLYRRLNKSVSSKAKLMLAEHIGTNLSLMDKEIKKMILAEPKTSHFEDVHIEQYVGLNKDYNVFELNNALLKGQFERSAKILSHFQQNSKDYPIQAILPALFNLFNKLFKLQALKTTNSSTIAKDLGIPPYFVQDYIGAKTYFGLKGLGRLIGDLKDIDLKSKGVGYNSNNTKDLYKEILISIAKARN
ncbi:MAG: DNA polymerase III subunit delta [Flavobacteriaceae bacterium]|nr:DNA polymerase III subunit delta [Flavobacteriaceae bacterium]